LLFVLCSTVRKNKFKGNNKSRNKGSKDDWKKRNRTEYANGSEKRITYFHGGKSAGKKSAENGACG
jgi:hypothetical protein